MAGKQVWVRPEDNATAAGTHIYTWSSGDVVFLLIGVDDTVNQAIIEQLPGEPAPTPTPVPSRSPSPSAEPQRVSRGLSGHRSIIGAVLDEGDRWSGWGDGGDDRIARKRDRLARLLSVVSILYSRGGTEAGVAVTEIAQLTGMTTRTVYRDLNALDEELGVPVFQAGRGHYGIDRKFFLRRCASPSPRRSSSSSPRG